MATASTIIDDLIRREGDRYTNHPADRGGPTKYGITKKTLARWRGQLVTDEDVQNLTEAEARQVYRMLYVDPFASIADPQLQGLLVDSAVQHGEARAVEWLQRALKVKVDRQLGPITARAANSRPIRDTYAEIVAQRCEFYGQLVTDDPKRVAAAIAGFRMQAENAHGWARRLAEFVRETAVL